MTIDQFSALPLSDIPQLSYNNITALPLADIGAMTPEQLKAMGTFFGYFTSTQLSVLLPQQISALDDYQIISCNLQYFSPTQIQAIPARLIPFFNPQGFRFSSLVSTQLLNLTSAQISSFTPSQIYSIINSQTPPSESTIAAFSWPDNSTFQQALSWSSQVTSLDSSQIATITPIQIWALSTNNLQALQSTIIPLLSVEQVQAIDPSAFMNLTPAQFSAFISNQIAALTGSQIAGLSTAQVASLDISLWTPAQIISISSPSALSPSQISIFSSCGIITDGSWLFSASSSGNQIAAISPSFLSLTNGSEYLGLTPYQVAGFTPTQIASMGQRGSLVGILQNNSFSLTQLAAITPGALSLLTSNLITPQIIQNLTLNQITGLTTFQISSMSFAQIKAFSTTQLQSLSQSQINAFTAIQLGDMSSAQLASIGKTSAVTGGSNTLNFQNSNNAPYAVVSVPIQGTHDYEVYIYNNTTRVLYTGTLISVATNASPMDRIVSFGNNTLASALGLQEPQEIQIGLYNFQAYTPEVGLSINTVDGGWYDMTATPVYIGYNTAVPAGGSGADSGEAVLLLTNGQSY